MERVISDRNHGFIQIIRDRHWRCWCLINSEWSEWRRRDHCTSGLVAKSRSGSVNRGWWFNCIERYSITPISEESPMGNSLKLVEK